MQDEPNPALRLATPASNIACSVEDGWILASFLWTCLGP